eukprot:748050-Hanusia_phi.AAC.4
MAELERESAGAQVQSLCDAARPGRGPGRAVPGGRAFKRSESSWNVTELSRNVTRPRGAVPVTHQKSP